MIELRNWIWRLFKGILFRCDAESVHHLSIRAIRFGSILGGIPLRLASGAPSEAGVPSVVFDLPFRSRLGLAAGFDKNSEIVHALPDLGFGFAEIGTVTPRAQPGNDRPRLFRDPDHTALLNRMGFNSLGAEITARNLERVRPGLPENFRVGVNLGKNKDTAFEQAHLDYANAIRPFEGLVDYVVANVSSPNTPGLRDLQTVESLKKILDSIQEVTKTWRKAPPILFKLAPEIQDETLRSLIQNLESMGVAGFVLTNTLLSTQPGRGTGGLSGLPLQEISRKSLKTARECTRLPLISVGGILSGEEAAWRVQNGADLIQIYSGWVFRGPAFPAEIRRRLDMLSFPSVT